MLHIFRRVYSTPKTKCQLKVHIELTTSMADEDQMYVCGLFIFATEDDLLSESVSDGDRVCLYNIIS